MTMTEKILARASGRSRVQPGDLVTVKVDKAVQIDLNFLRSMWREPLRVWDPERIVVIFDHIAPPKDVQSAEACQIGREFVRRFGIRRFHDVGGDQGICHQVIADEAYALPGQILVCPDSHTCSGGAFNCAARGIGPADLIYVLCKGETWFKVGETVRYHLEGSPPPAVTAKDVFLHIAGQYGDHAMTNVEFGGPGVTAMSLDARRTLATMCAEISAEFALLEADQKVLDYLGGRTAEAFEPAPPDPGARYAAVRTIDLGRLEPLVALPHTVVGNVQPVRAAAGLRIDQAFIGSCANGTLDDLALAARIVKGRRVAPGVRFIVTPGSQRIFREAVKAGIVLTLMEAGALVTNATCGACAGLHLGVLGPGERCLTASTRNFKGRMGSNEAEIYMASPAVVAASALTGVITDPRDFLGGSA